MHRAGPSLCFLLAVLAGILCREAIGKDSIMDVPAAVAKQLRAHKISPDDVSLYVHKVSEASPRVAFNARVPRNPASSIKTLTTMASLDLLGPTFSWKTVAYVTGEIVRGRLQGGSHGLGRC